MNSGKPVFTGLPTIQTAEKEGFEPGLSPKNAYRKGVPDMSPPFWDHFWDHPIASVFFTAPVLLTSVFCHGTSHRFPNNNKRLSVS